MIEKSLNIVFGLLIKFDLYFFLLEAQKKTEGTIPKWFFSVSRVNYSILPILRGSTRTMVCQKSTHFQLFRRSDYIYRVPPHRGSIRSIRLSRKSSLSSTNRIRDRPKPLQKKNRKFIFSDLFRLCGEATSHKLSSKSCNSNFGLLATSCRCPKIIRWSWRLCAKDFVDSSRSLVKKLCLTSHNKCRTRRVNF